MYVQEMTKKFRAKYYPQYALDEECVLFFCLDNGNILTALLRFEDFNEDSGCFKDASLQP